MKLILVRHGALAKENPEEFVGQRDVPLSEEGRRQTHRCLEHLLKEYSLTKIFSSPLSRCLEMAQWIGQAVPLSVEVDDRLKEMDLGSWQGKTVKEIFQQDPSADLFFPPQGETIHAFQQRVKSFCHKLLSLPENSTVLVVSHEGVLKILIMQLFEWPLSRFWDLTLDTASVTELKLLPHSPVEICRNNDTAYLKTEGVLWASGH